MHQTRSYLGDPASGQDVLDDVLATRHPYALLLLLCLALWLPGFFTLPPSDRDESRFALASRQMIESGDYVQIRNGDTARNQKPIGIYWLQAPCVAAARALGLATLDDIWPYRVPSALGGLLGVFATCWIGERMFGRRTALVGAAMLASSMVLATETHIAKTDAMLLAATTAVMGLLARAYLAPDRFGPRQATLMWLALGAAILIKGPITPMIAALCVAGLAFTDRGPGRRRWLTRLRLKSGLPLALLVVLPWFVAIGIATHGRFFDDSIGSDLGNKLAGGDDAHGAPPGFHFLLLAMALFPSSFVVLPALAAAWRKRREPATRFLLAWLVPSWLVFEAIPTKLPHYTLPMLPALCLLGARWALDPTLWAGRAVQRVSMAMFLIAAVLFGLGAAVLPKVVTPGWQLSAALGLPALAAAAAIAWLVLRARDPRRAVCCAVLAAPLFTWALLGFELPELHTAWIAPRVVAALRGREIPVGGFGSAGFAEPSLVFLHGADTRMLGDGRDGARFLAQGPGRVVAVARRDLAGFAEEAAKLQILPRAFAEVDGYNYSRGRRVELTLFEK